MKITVEAIAEHIHGRVVGNGDLMIVGVAEIENASGNQISFIANPKYVKYLDETQAGALIVSREVSSQNKTLIQVDDPYFGFLQTFRLFHPEQPPVKDGIHQTAIIGEHTSIGKNAAIGSYVTIGEHCQIGDHVQIMPGVVLGDDIVIGNDVRIYANVTIREGTKIGSRVIIQPGAVIGSDGFGYAMQNGVYHKIPQVGIVVIEDDVEIGANATIDRGTIGETRICQGVKIDNMVQVAHNVVIGKHSAVAAQTGIAGSTRFGDHITVGGQAGFVGHITVGDRAIVGAQSGVTKPIPSDTVVFGYPARPIKEAKKTEVYLRKLPDLFARLKKLEKNLKKD